MPLRALQQQVRQHRAGGGAPGRAGGGRVSLRGRGRAQPPLRQAGGGAGQDTEAGARGYYICR